VGVPSQSAWAHRNGGGITVRSWFYAQAHIHQGVAHLIIGVSAGGAFGVDLFFVLSSFLITTLLLREQKVYGAIDVASFYVRRIPEEIPRFRVG
jgi:peptidoglycan/LPS O-acetylase OafA/YrhL